MDQVKNILKGISSVNNEERNTWEKVLNCEKSNIKLYQILFEIFSNPNEDKFYQVQAITICKNLMKSELGAFTKVKFRYIEPSNKDLEELTSYVMTALTEVLSKGHFVRNRTHIQELILLLSNFYFPDEWKELNLFIEYVFSMHVEDIVSNLDYANASFELILGILKQHNVKRMPSSRSSYLKYKGIFNDLIISLYERLNMYFIQNIPNFTDMNFLLNLMSLLTVIDKIYILMIELGFSLGDFHKEDKLITMLNTALDKTKFLMDRVMQVNDSKIKQRLDLNLQKNLKYISRLISNSSTHILFFNNISSYIGVLLTVLSNAPSFSFEVVKVTLFSLLKVINTETFKLTDKANPSESASKDDTSLNNSSDMLKFFTPDKKSNPMNFMNNSSIKSITNDDVNQMPPPKFRNFSAEIQNAKELFSASFSKENLNGLLYSLILRIPPIYNNSNDFDNIESEILNDNTEEEFILLDSYSTEHVSFQTLNRKLLEALITNFKAFVYNTLKSEYIDYLAKFKELNRRSVEAVVNFINIVPRLYKVNVISEVEMIDYQRVFNFFEENIKAGEGFLLGLYIITINKWCEILISSKL